MMDDLISADEPSRAGLCADCDHARRIESARGSRFYFCELSRTDAAYDKYPRLPVLQCAGYKTSAKPKA